MPLPAELVNGLYVNGLPAAKNARAPVDDTHSQFTGANVKRQEQFYNCAYAPGPAPRRPGWQITDADPRNFLFVGNIQNGVAIGILPKRTFSTHVYSDNYSGCEFHVLSRADGTAAAFLHVYRAGGVAHDYTLGGNWVLRGTVASVGLAGPGRNIAAYAYVAAAVPWTAECCMLELDNTGMLTATHNAATFAL